MKSITLIGVILLSFGIYGQNFGSSNLTNALFNCDKELVLVKSTFNTAKVTFKKDGKKLISPSHTNSFIYFRDDMIGILVTPSEISKSQFMLTDVRVINDKTGDGKLLFYSKEKHLINVDYENNNINWSYSTDNVDYVWAFESLSLGNEAEIFDFIEMFQLENISLSDLSENSQNLIGLTEEQVLYRYSKHYKKPKLIERRIGRSTDENDLVLLFTSVDNEESYNIVIIDEHQICKYILSYYTNDFLKSISEIYREVYGEPTDGLTWFERVGDKKYSYTIDLISAMDSDKFVIHTKREE